MHHTVIPIRMSDTAQLQLWRLISPLLPIGAYAYSTGLEAAVETGWVRDEASAYEWIHGIFGHAYAHADVPIFARCYSAWQAQDMPTVQHWNALLLAMRESRELRLEDEQLGAALLKILLEQAVPYAAQLQAQSNSFASVFALACTHFYIPLTLAAPAMAFAWCENQVSAALKLIPLGQTAGQRLISRLLETIPAHVAQGMALADEAIGMVTPGLAMASARHETQYSRMFRS
jgi:urease accessory protein